MALIRAAPPAPSFAEELFRRGAVREVGLLLAVPAAMLAVFWLPDPVRDGLILRAEEPTLAAAFATHYVHRSVPHLAGNLGIYAVAAGLGYPLALLGGHRRAYLSVVTAVVLVYPLVFSGLHLSIHDQGTILGSSGVAFALVGALPVVLFAYLGARVDGAVSVADSPALFFLGAGAIAGRTAVVAPAIWPIVPIAALLGTLYLAPMLRRLYRGAGVRGRQLHRIGYVELPTVAVVAFFLAVAVAFPVEPPREAGATAGLAVHALAYALGFLGAFLADRLLWTLGPPAAPDPG